MARNKYPEETIKLILDVSTDLFSKKGYEKTSLQDIINKTKLSKGAIYHHFSSKEDILEAIFLQIGEKNAVSLSKIRDDKTLNGLEKLRTIIRAAILNSNQSLMLTITPNLLDNPKFLAMQIEQIYQIIAPKFIQPILQEGINDGSIKVKNSKEVSEAIMILMNTWLNPLVKKTNEQGMRDRCNTFNNLFCGIGIDNLLDEELINAYITFSIN